MANVNDPKTHITLAALRSLVIDMTNTAKSGHPGMALDVAPALLALYRDHFVSSPKHPEWENRDRFVLSSGHVSSLLYALLHVCGYELSLDDLQDFRQLGSLTPGHPEAKRTNGVDASTGPLGQGFANAVGMAMAEEAIRAQYKDVFPSFGHYTYCLMGDGDVEEGISLEAMSLAGQQKLSRLIVIYDANGSTMDSPIADTLTDYVKARFLSAGWGVLDAADSEDVNGISALIGKAKEDEKRPSLIIVHSKIGYGTSKQGSHKIHGSPLGAEEGEKAKKFYGYEEPAFTVVDDAYALLRQTFAARGDKAYGDYVHDLRVFFHVYPQRFATFADGFAKKFGDFEISYPEFEVGSDVSTRACSGKILKAVHDALPFTFGGAADVGSSTKTDIEGEADFGPKSREGRNVLWGIREFAMAACCNGIALHGGLLPYASCFLVFADYMKPAIRLAAMQNLQVLYIFSHDSIAVGEDGPTHQPIEQLAMLRCIPNLVTFRPADGKEAIAAYQAALARVNGPTAIVTSRQDLPTLESTDVKGAARGAYLVYGDDDAEWEIIATGSEVAPSIEVAKKLAAEGCRVAVVSMPSREIFKKQGKYYMDRVLFLPKNRRISVEMASTFGFGDLADHNIGIDEFGASGKAKDLINAYGFNVTKLLSSIEAIVK